MATLRLCFAWCALNPGINLGGRIIFVLRTRLTVYWWCHICKWSFNNGKKITWSSIESLSFFNFWSLGADLLVPPNKEDFFHLREFFKAPIMYLLVTNSKTWDEIKRLWSKLEKSSRLEQLKKLVFWIWCTYMEHFTPEY